MITDWVEIIITVTQDTEEAIANLLCELGSNGVVMDAGEEVDSRTVAGYVPAGDRIQDKLRSIRTLWQGLCDLGLANGACQVAVRSVPMSDWTSWQARFKPIDVSDRIVIKPPWAPVRKRENQVVIEIVPGLAFGTGEHETTQLCLHALEECMAPGDRVLDTGTGSGILSIAAAKLGADRVVAVEVDDVALEAALENVQRNGVANDISLYLGSVDHPSVTGPFRVIVSNTETRTIRTLLSDFRRLLEPDGVLVLSGVLQEESEALSRDIEAQGFSLMKAAVMGEWWSCVVRPDVS
ncbi:MAG: 50S ribosomal protein L11 methyltransferase [Gemmatimonadota bacterium]|nr:50S ribosomal protein L11 methyltransferase [Gemmatimonadota bacterium]